MYFLDIVSQQLNPQNYIFNHNHKQQIKKQSSILQISNKQISSRSLVPMRYIVQIVSNNILQQIPTIIITYQHRTNQQKYIFNVPQHFCRYNNLHDINYSHGMNIFFTKYNTQAISGLTRLFLQLNERKFQQIKCYDTKVYFDQKNYKYWVKMKKFMGFRLLPYSFYNFNTRQVLMGLKNQEQLQRLMAFNKMKFMRGDFNNQQLKQIIKIPSNAGQYIKSSKQQTNNQKIDDKNTSISYKFESKDSNIKIFTITNKQNNLQIFYNYIFTTQQIPGKVSQQKLTKVATQHNLSKTDRINLVKTNKLILPNGLTIDSSLYRQADSPSRNVIILHYKTIENLNDIKNNSTLTQHLVSTNSSNINKIKNSKPANSIIHIIQGDGSLLFTRQFTQLKKLFGDNHRHIIYNRCYFMAESVQQLRKQLQLYPHYKVCKEMRKIGGGYIQDIGQNVIKIYQKYIMNILNANKSNNILKQVVPYKHRYEIVLSPIRLQGYHKKQKPQQQVYRFPNRNIPPRSQKVAKQYQQDLIKKLQNLTQKIDPKVIFLGTSSMLSTLYRNVSGIVIKFQQKQIENNDKSWSVVLDCGDGVYNQFMNHFGVNFYQQLIKVRILFLSHMHQDHVAGVFNFISKRNQAIKDKYKQNALKQRQNLKLFVILPKNIAGWFQQFNSTIQKLDQFCEIIYSQSLTTGQLQQTKKHFKKLNVSIFKKNQKQSNSQKLQDREILTLNQCLSNEQEFLQVSQEQNDGKKQQQKQKLIQKYTNLQKKIISQLRNFLKKRNIIKFIPVPVLHCNQSYGLIIQHNSSIKISYSGDCRPTSQFISMAKNSTLMIHQSTFNSQQKQKAKRFWHSTTAQAVQIGFKSYSVMTALTHFNSRFGTGFYGDQKIQFIDAKVEPNYKKYNVFKCKDHLEFKISQMHKLPYIMQKVSLIF